MADLIISPYAISFNSIKNCLQSYIQNKSDVETTWKDFYVSSAGETILELDAAVAAFYAFHFIIGRRESYLTLAQNYNSVVGGALSLGYNCSRGHNVHIRLNITPAQSQTLSKWTVIGSYAEYDVVLLEDVILNKGIPTNVSCVIGNSSAQSVKMTSSDLQQFVFTSENTTDDVRLILTDREVPFATELKEAVNDKYILLTNPYGSVDVFYLNNGLYNYGPSDVLYLQYIERNNLQFGSLSKSNLAIDIATVVNDMTLIEDRLDKEDKEHIRLAAPIYHETNNVVRARKDYKKFLLETNPLILDTNDKDINPGLIALTYLKKYDSQSGTSLLTEQEKQNYVKSIMDCCPDGVAKAFIEDPVRVVRSLAINIWKKSDENIEATLEDDIETILDTFRNRLAPVLDLQQIEHDIEQLKGVKVARVDLGAREYSTNTKYKLYDVITVPKIQVGTELQTWTLYAGKIQSKTGEEEPDWATAGQVGDQIQDNNFIWENSNKYAQSLNAVWKKDGSYELYSDINVGYTVAPGCTLKTPPLWGSQLQKDGNITWNMIKNYISKLAVRADNTKYSLNQQVIVKQDPEQAIYNAIKITHKSSKEQPYWSIDRLNETVSDNAITWQYKYNAWRTSYNYLTGDVIAVGKDDKVYVYRALTDGQSGEECPLDGNSPIADNTVNWYLINTFDGFTQWEANKEIPLNSWISANDKLFNVIDIDNITSGESTVFYTGAWQEEIVDNNITWHIDTYEVDETVHNCIGGEWKGETPFEENQTIICSSTSTTYIYQVSYVGTTEIQAENVIFSVVNYAGTTSKTEPEWGPENVEDNDILWTKTDNISDIGWEASTSKRHGDIITTAHGNYVFSSVLGTSGNVTPDWTGIQNNQVIDNNITWVRISDALTMALQWNEYLDLKADSPTIM